MFALKDLVTATQNKRLTPKVRRQLWRVLLRRVTVELAAFEFENGTRTQAANAAALAQTISLALEGEKAASELEKPALAAV